MSLRSMFEWFDVLESSIALRQSINAYPLLLTAHVLSMALFAGVIIFWDLRLAGLALRPVRVSMIQRRLFPWALGIGFVISTVTGLLLLYSQPMRYYSNFYFWVKNIMMVAAGVNVLVFHTTTYHSVDVWDTDSITPRAAKWAGYFSLVMWAGIIITGRMIAYSGLVPQWWANLGLDQ